MDNIKNVLNKITIQSLSLLAILFLLYSCSSPTSVFGVWQDTTDKGTIEFKENGEVIIIDNMSATVTGTFEVKDNKTITFELTATDIMRDSIQPIEKTIVTAKIIKFNNDDLHLTFAGETEIEQFKRRL
jgi:hypothetical protein